MSDVGAIVRHSCSMGIRDWGMGEVVAQKALPLILAMLPSNGRVNNVWLLPVLILHINSTLMPIILFCPANRDKRLRSILSHKIRGSGS